MKIVCLVTCLAFYPCAALLHVRHENLLFAHSFHVGQREMRRVIQHDFFGDKNEWVANSNMLCITPFVSRSIWFQSTRNYNRLYLRGPNRVVGNIDAAVGKFPDRTGTTTKVGFLKRIATLTTAILIALSSMKVSRSKIPLGSKKSDFYFRVTTTPDTTLASRPSI